MICHSHRGQNDVEEKIWCWEILCHLVFGQLVMLVQCCAEAPPLYLSIALHRHDQVAKNHPVPWLRWHNASWHQVFCLPEGWESISRTFKLKLRSSLCEYVRQKLVYVARCGLILKQDEAIICLENIDQSLPAPERATTHPTLQNIPKCQTWFSLSWLCPGL